MVRSKNWNKKGHDRRKLEVEYRECSKARENSLAAQQAVLRDGGLCSTTVGPSQAAR